MAEAKKTRTQLSDRKIVRDQIGTNSRGVYLYISLFLAGVFALSAVFGLIKKSNSVIIATAVGVLISVIVLYFISRPIRACIKAVRNEDFSVVIDTVKDIIVSPDDSETYVVEFASSEMIYQTKTCMAKGDQAYLIIVITPRGLYSCANFYPLSEYEYNGKKEVIVGQTNEK